jgi:hypothetical protein
MASLQKSTAADPLSEINNSLQLTDGFRDPLPILGRKKALSIAPAATIKSAAEMINAA